MNSIGDRIKELRKSEDLTQKEFAKRLLVSQSYLSGIENGNEIPTNKLIKLICLEFGVNENWLCSNHGDMYDEIYENNKVSLVEESNEALLKMMLLLSTKSNVEYGYYSLSFAELVSTLRYGQELDEELKMEYLELVQKFMMNFSQVVRLSFAKNPNSVAVESCKAELSDDLQNIYNFLEDEYNTQNNV